MHVVPRCPHCDIQNSGVELKASIGVGDGRSWFFGICRNKLCKKVMLVEKISDNLTVLLPLGDFRLDSHAAIMQEIRDDFEEAGKCLLAGCHKASMVMSRRTMQRVLKEQGCEQHRLVDAIRHAIDNGILRRQFHDVANEIREYGNLGAHPDDDQLGNCNAESAGHLLDFVQLLIHEFYEVPAKVGRLKASRKAAKS
ncbi:MAG: DUF4145 domain-containing protein [Planctomycetes bacterium]|nr:DUF4145 domain-containing protein [Planctomycetota bacterium]